MPQSLCRSCLSARVWLRVLCIFYELQTIQHFTEQCLLPGTAPKMRNIKYGKTTDKLALVSNVESTNGSSVLSFVFDNGVSIGKSN